MNSRTALAIVCGLALAGCRAPTTRPLAENDVLFYAPFDESLDAAQSGGAASPVGVAGTNRLVDGHHGQGLLIGGAGSGVSYPTAGNLDAAAGTVALWIKPVDWRQDSYTRFFFRVHQAGDAADDGFLWLYKLTISSVCWLAQQRTPQTMVYILAPRAPDWPGGGDEFFEWQQGQWSHLLATWSGNQMSLFINGRYVESTYLPCAQILPRLADTFLVGGANQKEQGVPDTVIDELLILRQPVTPEQARLIYENGIAACRPPGSRKPVLQLQAAYSYSKERVIATASLMGRRPDDLNGLMLSYELLRGTNSAAIAQGTMPVTGLRQTITVTPPPLADGEYRLRARLSGKAGGDHPLAEAEHRFQKLARAEWAENTIGVCRDVPAPFTALERQGNRVTCWGRAYDWGAGAALPQRINAQGAELIARPISLVAVVGGARCSLENTTIRWDETSPTRVAFTAAGQLQDVPVQVTGWLGFDGFLWCEIQVGDRRTRPHQRLSSLAIEIPFRRAVATLVHGQPAASGALGEFNGPISVSPVIWIGDDNRGLQWSTEETRDWHLQNPDNMVRLTFRGDEAVLRLTLLDHAIESDRPLAYTLGLQATPVKPLDKNFRSWELKLANSAARQPGWQYWWQSWNRQTDTGAAGPYGYNVTGPKALDELQAFHAQNLRPFLYWTTGTLWVGDPVLENNRVEWSDSVRRMYGGEWDGYPDPSGADPFNAVMLYPDQPAIRDYLIWRNWRTLTDNPALARGVAGFYLDVCQPMWKRARGRDGDYYNRYTLLGTRELQKRFYCMLKQDWPEILVSNHQSADTVLSQLAFSDMLLTGEHLLNNPRLGKELGYYHVLSLDALRAEYTSAKFGLPIVFLPETLHAVLGDPVAEQKIAGVEGHASSEHLVGLLWVHDIIPWIAYVNKQPFQLALRAKEAFGWDQDTTFVGYWETSPLLNSKADQSPVITSFFRRNDKVLFVTMNNSDDEARVELRPDWAALEIEPPAALADAYQEEAAKVPMENGAARFTVKARNFRALVTDSGPPTAKPTP